MFNAINSNAIISKSKKKFWIFFCISEIYITFRIFWQKKVRLTGYLFLKIYIYFFCFTNFYKKLELLSKKRWSSKVIPFLNYRLQKAELLKCPKNPMSEHLWTVNMLMGPEHCLNLHGSIFGIFFDQLQRKSAPRIVL